MRSKTKGIGVADPAVYRRGKLLITSMMALATAGMVFSIRASMLGELRAMFLDPVSPMHSSELIGAAVGAAFVGLAVANLIGGPMCDFIGMRRLLGMASVLQIVGTSVLIFARPISAVMPIFWILWSAMMAVGLANGFTEAAINPLIATLYPEDKTHKLNVLHAWWPAGIIIGGLLSVGLGALGVGWQVKQAVIFVPAAIYGLLAVTTKFPPTERLAAGVSDKEMFKEALRPMFIVWFLCMFLTASSELAPGQWVDAALSHNAHIKGILLLVYVSGIMFVMRHFAGALARRFTPVGLLWLSALLAAIGLLCFSFASSPLTAILSATIWGAGVCYMWPTMLAVTSERFPKGGAFLLSLIGTAGSLSVFLVLPSIGRIIDVYKTLVAQKLGVNVVQLAANVEKGIPGAKARMDAITAMASPSAFKWVAILPAVLLLVFGVIWLRDKAMGGYKAARLTDVDEEMADPAHISQ